jgi:polysaccharide biosynthesis transport protein
VELRDYLRVLRRSWILVLGLLILSDGAATAYSLLVTPEYQATTKVFVSTQTATSVSDLTQGNTYTQQVVQSYADIVTTPIVLDPVIARLGIEESPELLAKRITASAPLNTVVIQISATDVSPEHAADIANGVARSFISVVGTLTPATASGVTPVKVTIVQEASVPIAPSSPIIPLNIALGLLVGLALGVGVAVLRYVVDTRVRGIHDVQAVTQAPILGGIAFDSNAVKHPLIVQDDPRSPRAESFRSLRTNLQFLDYGGRAHSFVFTSAIEGEGKTTTVSNLAIALADNGAKVVVVDADLRQPRLASTLGLEGAVGLTDVLIDTVSLDDALQKWGTGTLQVLPAGKVPPNPSELLGSQSMTDVLTILTSRFDVVLIDSPPLLPVSDAAILSKRTGGAILIAAAGKTRRSQLKGALDVLDGVGAEVLGIVLTMLPTKGPDAYGYGHAAYGYFYGYGEGKGATEKGTAKSEKPAAGSKTPPKAKARLAGKLSTKRPVAVVVDEVPADAT